MSQPEHRPVHSAAMGTFWAYVQNWAARGITLLVFFTLARLLTPTEFGVFAIALIFITVGEIFVEQLFAHVIVQRDRLEAIHLDTAFWSTLILGGLLAAGTMAGAPAYAAAFDSPGAAPVVMALAPVFGFMALACVPAALLRRSLDYRTLARRTAVSNLASGVAAIIAAAAGLGVWTFVIQQLVFQIVSTWILWRSESWRPRFMYSLAALRALFGFSARITAVKLLDLVETRVVELVVARQFGVAVLGQYALAARAQQAATQLLAAPLWESSFSAFARLQGDSAALVTALQGRLFIAAVAVVPAFLIAAATAPALVPAVFGPQWGEAVAPFQVLCLLSAGRVFLYLCGAALQGIGASDVSLRVGIIRSASTLLSLLGFVEFGLVGVSLALLLGQILVAPIIFYYLRLRLGVQIQFVLQRVFLPVCIASVSSTLGFVVVDRIISAEGVVLASVVSVVLAAGAYIILMAVFMPNVFSELLGDKVLSCNKVRIVGAFGERNFGDDLLMVATANFVKASMRNPKIFIATDNPESSSYIYRRIPDVRFDRRSASIRRYVMREIFAGGTQFYSFSAGGGQEVRKMSIVARLAKKVREEGVINVVARIALKSFPIKPKRYAVGIGIGPFDSGNESESRNVLKDVDRIWVRDEESLRYPRSWGFGGVDVGADICFASSLLELPVTDIVPSRRVLGVIVRGWSYATTKTDYLKELVLVLKSIQSDFDEVRVFAFCRPVDREAIRIMTDSGFLVDVWDPDIESEIDYMRRLGECQCFISARFHGVVVGALLGRPSIGIALDPKVRQISNRLGLGEYVWSDPFDGSVLTKMAREFASKVEDLAVMLRERRAAEEEAAVKMLSSLSKELA